METRILALITKQLIKKHYFHWNKFKYLILTGSDLLGRSSTSTNHPQHRCKVVWNLKKFFGWRPQLSSRLGWFLGSWWTHQRLLQDHASCRWLGCKALFKSTFCWVYSWMLNWNYSDWSNRPEFFLDFETHFCLRRNFFPRVDSERVYKLRTFLLFQEKKRGQRAKEIKKVMMEGAEQEADIIWSDPMVVQ